MSGENEHRRKVKEIARRFGWDLTETRGGHLRLRNPRTGAVVIVAKSSKNWHAVKNCEAAVRRAERAWVASEGTDR